MPDAGFFLDLPDVNGVDCWPAQMRSVFNLSGAYLTTPLLTQPVTGAHAEHAKYEEQAAALRGRARAAEEAVAAADARAAAGAPPERPAPRPSVEPAA